MFKNELFQTNNIKLWKMKTTGSSGILKGH